MSAPNWKPLEAVLPLNQCGDWMWMGTVEHDGRAIEQYKHRMTRGYLNVDQDGQVWRVHYVTDGCDPWCDVEHEHRTDSPPTFAQVPIETALEWALS